MRIFLPSRRSSSVPVPLRRTWLPPCTWACDCLGRFSSPVTSSTLPSSTRTIDTLKGLVRQGIDLSVRARAAASQPRRQQRREERQVTTGGPAPAVSRLTLRKDAEAAVERAVGLARQARERASAGNSVQAQTAIEEAAREIRRGIQLNESLIGERSMIQILASVGIQMAAFVHEINALIGMASSLEVSVERLREKLSLDAASRKVMARLHGSLTDLRRVVERHAAYLTDITSPDARRRGSRQKIAERFDKRLPHRRTGCATKGSADHQ